MYYVLDLFSTLVGALFLDHRHRVVDGGRMLRFAQAIRTARRRRLLSQRDLAREMGVRYQTIQAYEQGHALPHLSTQRKLVAALGLDPAELADLVQQAEEERARASQGPEDDRGQSTAGGETSGEEDGAKGPREVPET